MRGTAIGKLMLRARMATSRQFVILICALPLLAAGCAAIAGRGDKRFYPGAYAGVRYDAYYLGHPDEADLRPTWPLVLFDLPFSGALDTVLLPFDGVNLAVRTNQTPKAENK
jgi:uncharacterized protein YceK